MRRVVLTICGLLVALSAHASVTAVWTGKQERVQTVTYQWKWKCEYQYAGRYYYFLFDNSCPSSVELE
jgi:hypothetical protein